ncbi:MAG: enoyl-CoA hydratase [Alphaproteobacteria bacterium]|nr:MAG: enoyl-CoA hydratase [Alphaproteobacteria bacterium]
MTTASVKVLIEERTLGAIARVTIENAAKLNTLDSHLMIAFVGELEALAKRDDLRAVVLTGGGEKAFIGGANIFEMATLDAEHAEAFITLVHRSCNALRELPVPAIARVNGYALGAGLEVAAACDLRIASSNAVFGMPEVKVGIPSVVEAALLPGLIGWGRTRELLLFGENIDAATALAWGLVEQVVAPGALDAAVDKRLAALLAAGPQAVRRQKKLIRDWEDMTVAQAVRAGIECFTQAYSTDEPARMMADFAKRKRS